MAVTIPSSVHSVAVQPSHLKRRHSNFHPKAKLFGPQKRCVSAPARLLPRPPLRAPRRETINAAEPSLSEVPTDYILESLKAGGLDLYRSLAQTRALKVPQGALPQTLEVGIGATTQSPPTHILAVYTRRTSSAPSAKTQVALYPAHAIVLAASCSNLPALPLSTGASKNLPVTPLCLPDGTTFAALLEYLYCRNASTLVTSLLRPAGADRRIAAARVHGLWRDACALGVSDEGLWDALDAAWAAAVGGRA